MGDEWTVAQILRILLTALLLGSSALGLTVLLLVTAPAFVDWAEREIVWRRKLSFVRGLLVLCAFAGVFVIMGWLGRSFYGLAMVIFAICEFLLLMGFGVTSLQIGKKVAIMLNKPDIPPLVAVILGAIVVGASMGVPVVGWAISGYFICLGLGAVVGAIVVGLRRTP